MELSAGVTIHPVPPGAAPSIALMNSSAGVGNHTNLVDEIDAGNLISQSLHLVRPLSVALVLGWMLYRCIKYFTMDLPPWGSGLKSLPGPISTVPYLGRIHDVDKNEPWTAMKKFSDIYDGLFSCTLGGETHIWIAREDIAQDLLCTNSAISSSRANLGAYPDVLESMRYLPLIGFTDHHFRQRKFATQIMARNVKNGFQGYLTLEVKRFMKELLEQPGNFHDGLFMCYSRISSRLAYGNPDSAREHVINSNRFIHQLGPSGPITNLIPFLGKFPEWIIRDKKDVRERQEREEHVWRELFKEAKRRYMINPTTTPSTYVSEALRTTEGAGKETLLLEDEEEAKFAVGMLCIIPVFTIQGPAVLFVLGMVLHPEWQEKVQREIDEVIPANEMLDLHHMPQLPTLRACILEGIRWRSTLPLGVPRLLEEDYTHSGYHFPKHAVVHILDIAVSQSTDRYVRPDLYNPGRWLDPASPNYREPLTEFPRIKGHHIFGRGKRGCPGQDMAEAALYVQCGNMVKNFRMEPKRGEKGEPLWPSDNDRSNDVIGGPKEFECVIRARSEERREIVEAWFEEAFPEG